MPVRRSPRVGCGGCSMGRDEDRLHRAARPAGVPARPGDRHRSPFLQGSAGCVGGDGIVLTCEEPCFQSAMTRSPAGGKAAGEDKGSGVVFGSSYGLRIATVAPTVKKTTPVPLSSQSLDDPR